MATYFGTSINESPTIVLPAKEKIEGVQGIALAISGGQLTKPTAGANVIGLSLFTNGEFRIGCDVHWITVGDTSALAGNLFFPNWYSADFRMHNK